MNMRKTGRILAALLILALLCGMIPAAGAEVVTVGVYFSGRRIAEDGSESFVKLEGSFRVIQNGLEVGVIRAGKDTLTLPDTEKIRIEPLPETISPEWNLKGSAVEFVPEGGGTLTVPVVVDQISLAPAEPEPTPEPAEVPAAADEPETEGEPEEEPETLPAKDEEIAAPPAPEGPVTTPTLPPFDASVLAPTPEPEWKSLAAGNGSIRAFAFYDQNHNGLAGADERGVAGVTVCLMTEDGEAVTALETGDDGIALFSGLPEGGYRIKAILPRGWAFERKSSEPEPYASIFGSSYNAEETSDVLRLGAGETLTPGISLGKALHVSGTCWFEEKVDGLFAEGEPVLPGVRIELNGEKNGLHYETWSDANGEWFIDRVAPAGYRMTVYVPDGMMFTRVPNKNGRKTFIAQDGVSSATKRVDLNDNESKNKLYIGFTWAGQVKGICFLDANYNGLYDEGEAPMPGVKVTAIKQAKDEEAAVTFSGEDGTYVLNGLRENTYRMRAVLPDDGSDFTRVVSDPAGNHFASRPGRRENFLNDFVLANAQVREMNVGVIYPASVSGTVYLDDDFSATQNGKEKIVTTYLVKLVDENGATVTMDKTSVKGKYELTRIPPGDYSLQVTALKGYAFTKLGEGNVILNRTNGEGYSETFHLDLKEKKTGMDIGMIQPGGVSGAVFADRNDNGIRDEGENGLPGVIVRLMGEEGEAFRAEIGNDGNYVFDAVMPGTYHLEYTLPEGAVFARLTEGGNTISGEGTGESSPITLSSGQFLTGPVCGALTLGRIEGLAYADHDGDGVYSDSEEPAAGVSVTLTPGRSELETLTVTTGPDGRYRLEALRPDQYTLTVTAPEGLVVSRTDNLALPLTAGKDTQSVQLDVAMGQTWTDQQIGVVKPASLKGQLWLDENNNGLFDAAESTPAGYEVIVTDDRNGKVFDTLRTDEQGFFATSGMIPGSFTLSFPLDADTIAPKEGDSQFREEAGSLVLSGILLAEGEEKEGILLGMVKYTSIGGTVWIDRGDRVDTLGGARVVLKDEAGNELKTVTTAENGAYKFDKLLPGIFRLEATMPEGCVIIEPGDPRLGGDQISVMTETLNRTGSSDTIDLKMGEDRMKMNIGCVLPGRLGDLVWLDLDKDGLQGMDEPGIPNVKITLIRDGEAVAETVTDQYGFYRFSDLYPAVYFFRVEAPAGIRPTIRKPEIPIICSVLEEEAEDGAFVSVGVQVESDKANYNADMGFVLTGNTLPAGVGEGKTQDWTGSSDSHDD